MNRSVMVLAGEVSGDMHVAGVIRELKKLDPSLSFWGMAGDQCADAGMDILYHTDDMAVMGLAEVLKKYSFFKRAFKRMLQELDRRKPDAVIMVDYPGFNLRFAKKIKAKPVKKIYYISPQVWAWKKARIKLMAECLDKLLVIFPFEVSVFEGTGLAVEYVGHPLVDEARVVYDREPVKFPDADHPMLALLPGSRRQEIDRILPDMLDAVQDLARRQIVKQVIIAAPNKALAAVIETTCRSLYDQLNISVITGRTRDVLRSADAAVIVSGTATIEAALMQCPMVIVYKTSWLTYCSARVVLDIPHIGMVNIVAGREVCPELIQKNASPANISFEIERILKDENYRAGMLKDIADVNAELSAGSVSKNAAVSILDTLNSH